jgi:acyl dehydratase
MIDTSFIGWVSPPSTVEVEKGRLRFFAQAIGETNPLYTNEAVAQAAGYRSLPIPLTFLFCLEMDHPSSFKLLETLNVSLARILHGEQSFTYHQPVCAGDCITFQSKVSDIYSKKGGALEFIVQDTTARNQDEVLVGEMRSVIVVRN